MIVLEYCRCIPTLYAIYFSSVGSVCEWARALVSRHFIKNHSRKIYPQFNFHICACPNLLRTKGHVFKLQCICRKWGIMGKVALLHLQFNESSDLENILLVMQRTVRRVCVLHIQVHVSHSTSICHCHQLHVHVLSISYWRARLRC